MAGDSEPFSVSAEVLDVHQRRDKLPAYPPQAKSQKIQGTVRLRLRVDRAGKITEVTAVEGPQILRTAALDGVRQRVYSPFLRNGTAVAVVGDAYLTFTLDPDAQMEVFPGDDIDAILDKAMLTVLDLRADQTEKYCFEAIRRARAIGDHSHTIRNALEILYQLYSGTANGEPSRAGQVRERMVAVMSEQEQPNGYWTAQALFSLGEFHLGFKRYAVAGEYFKRALPLVESCVDRPGTRLCSMLLGDVLGYEAIVMYAQNRFAESIPFFERAISRPDGAIHESTQAAAMTIYANVLYQVGRNDDAVEAVKRAKEYQLSHPAVAKKADP